jgi:hypothetical protein
MHKGRPLFRLIVDE